jgi:hypothetical protein
MIHGFDYTTEFVWNQDGDIQRILYGRYHATPDLMHAPKGSLRDPGYGCLLAKKKPA